MACEALRFDPAANLGDVDHPVAHHPAVVELVRGRREPVAHMEGQQERLSGARDLLLLGVPPHVVNIVADDLHVQKLVGCLGAMCCAA